jgi:hypothetical protein
MARKSQSGIVSRPRKGKAPSYSDYRRLEPDELKRLGYSKGSKRRVLKSVRRITKSTPTLSDRAFAEIKLSDRLGQKTTKESFRELARTGKAKYTQQAASAKDARFLRQFIPQIAPKHLTVSLKYLRNGGRGGPGFNSLDSREQAIFRSMFAQYPRDDVRQALGSAAQDTGSFAF